MLFNFEFDDLEASSGMLKIRSGERRARSAPADKVLFNTERMYFTTGKESELSGTMKGLYGCRTSIDCQCMHFLSLSLIHIVPLARAGAPWLLRQDKDD